MIYPPNTERPLLTQTKRKRGGQRGNQNARKHGFYSALAPEAEICEFWKILNTEGIDPQLAVWRLKLYCLLRHDPGNRRALREASKLLAKWYAAEYHLGRKGERFFKNVVLYILENYQPQKPGGDLQNESSVP